MQKQKTQRLHKIVAIVGGFLILAGLILLGIAALSVFGYLNVGLMISENFALTFAIMLTAIGLLDTFAAIIIARW